MCEHVAQQIVLASRVTYFSVLKTNLLSETIVSQTQQAVICSNSIIIGIYLPIKKFTIG